MSPFESAGTARVIQTTESNGDTFVIIRKENGWLLQVHQAASSFMPSRELLALDAGSLAELVMRLAAEQERPAAP